MSITSLYHFSVVMKTTKVIHRCDLLKFMDETQGQRLKRLRLAKKLTQKEVAKFGDVGQTAIANIEADARGYGAGIVGIAKGLGTTPEYLQLDDQLKPVSTLSGSQAGASSYCWPFLTVSPTQYYEVMTQTQRDILEATAHSFVGARESPEKQEAPAPSATKVHST
jgi:transcriptional regulator with XRE-family HTH domain